MLKEEILRIWHSRNNLASLGRPFLTELSFPSPIIKKSTCFSRKNAFLNISSGINTYFHQKIRFSTNSRANRISSLLIFNPFRYTLCVMIQSFKCKETEKIFNREFSKKLPRDFQGIAFRKLRMLNRSVSLNDLRVPPANRLLKLHGEREGQLSIRINDQY